MMNSSKTDKIKAIMCILLAAFGFSLMTFFVRISGDVPTVQKAFFRNAFAAVIAFFPLIKSEEKFHIKKGCFGDIAFRCLFGTSGLICNFYAIDRLDIADANMLNKLSPFFAIILSIFILKEVPTFIDILATVIAFIGALFIIRPGADVTVIPALIGLYGGFGAGTAYVFVRKLGSKGERTPIIVMCFSLFSCIVTFPFLIFDYHPMSSKQWLFLILAGLSASLGQFSITTAYKYAPAKEISVFDYTQVIFAGLLGIIFLGETPVPLSIIGYIIIIGTAFARWWLTIRKESLTHAQQL
jgi:drug/metabolite transporter (DMT)-like permease